MLPLFGGALSTVFILQEQERVFSFVQRCGTPQSGDRLRILDFGLGKGRYLTCIFH
jgi:hypothetical protein